MIAYGTVLSLLFPYGPYGPIWSCMICYGPVRTHTLLYGTVGLTMVPYGPVGTVWYHKLPHGPVWYCIEECMLSLTISELRFEFLVCDSFLLNLSQMV